MVAAVTCAGFCSLLALPSKPLAATKPPLNAQCYTTLLCLYLSRKRKNIKKHQVKKEESFWYVRNPQKMRGAVMLPLLHPYVAQWVLHLVQRFLSLGT